MSHREVPARSWLVALLSLVACAAPPADLDALVETSLGAIRVRSAGVGPDLVLLHGLGDSGLTWHRIEGHLRAAGYRVHVVDALGAGGSSRPRGGRYDLAAHATRLHEVLVQRGVERAVLIGNSLGGSTALVYAMEHRERVAALILLAPAAWAKGGWTGGTLWRFPDLIESAMDHVPPRLIAWVALLANFGNPLRITEELVLRYAAELAHEGTVAAYVAQQQQVLPDPATLDRWTSGYPSLDVPTLLFWGTRDRILDPAMGERLVSILPSARLVRLPGIGHVPQLEDPDPVLDEVLAFLASL